MSKRYTTRQISELLNFSSQHIRATAKRLQIDPTKENKSFIYTENDLKKIAGALGVDLRKQERSDKTTGSLELEIKLLKECIEEKDRQIEDLRAEKKDLMDTIKAQAFALASSAQKELAEPRDTASYKQSADPIETPKKRGVIERFKRWLAGD